VHRHRLIQGLSNARNTRTRNRSSLFSQRYFGRLCHDGCLEYHALRYTESLSSLLFIVALYIDVRLTLELAGKENISDTLQARIASVRVIGTTSATVAMFLFVVATALLGWLTPRRITGVVTTIMGLFILLLLLFIWFQIGDISLQLNQPV